VDRVEGCCPRGGEGEEGGQRPKGWKGWGSAATNWEKGRGRLGLGRGGGRLPSIGSRSKAQHALPSELPTSAEKMPKDLLFP
jgi:hypothetical protein